MSLNPPASTTRLPGQLPCTLLREGLSPWPSQEFLGAAVPCCPWVDAEVERQAEEALSQTSFVPERTVRASCHAHTLTLSGSVAWRYQRDAAAHAIREIHGVGAVINAIRVQLAITAGPVIGSE